MPNCQKWMALSVLFFLFVAVPAVYAQSDGQESIETVSSVYFTRDLSEKGLKKLYKKALPSRAGKVVFKEYLPDDYLFNAMDNMLASEQKTDGKEIYDSFLSVLHESHVKPLFPVLDGRKKDLYAWHDFAFVPCLCYAKDYLNGNPAEMCQKLPWFPSDECRDIKRNLEYYGQKITDPKTLVVVSALSVPSAKGAVRREGALQNMMGGNNLFSAASGNRASPLAVIWEKRLTSVDKNTLCVNIIAKAGADGKETAFGAVASVDCTMADKAAWDILQQADPSVDTASAFKRLALWSALVRNRVPDGIYEYYGGKNEEKNVRRMLKFFADRAAERYRLITLD